MSDKYLSQDELREESLAIKEELGETRRGKPRELTPAEKEAKDKSARIQRDEMQRQFTQKSSKHFDFFPDAANWRKGMKIDDKTQKVRIRRRVEGFDVVLYQRKEVTKP